MGGRMRVNPWWVILIFLGFIGFGVDLLPNDWAVAIIALLATICLFGSFSSGGRGSDRGGFDDDGN